MYSTIDLPEELIELLALYCDGRSPALAGCLIEDLTVMSQRADSDLERCTFSAMLKHWLGVDHSRLVVSNASMHSQLVKESRRWRTLSTGIVASVSEPTRIINDA